MELESHEHYETLWNSFKKPKVGCLSFSKLGLIFSTTLTTFLDSILNVVNIIVPCIVYW